MPRDCPKCDQHTEKVNSEPRRVVMLVVWYEHGKPYIGREPDLIEFWKALPEDGFEAMKGYYNHRNPSNNAPLGFNLSGCDFYFMTPEGIVGGCYANEYKDPAKDIPKRYPGAIVKRGKWTTPANIDRINEEMAAWR